MARDKSLMENSWFSLLKTLELAGAAAFETSSLVKFSCGGSGDQCAGIKFSNLTNQKQQNF